MAEMPAHTHIFSASSEPADQFAMQPDRRLAVAAANAYNTSTSSIVEMADGTVTHTGGGQSHDNVQPFQTVNYCIALTGYYPPRN